MLSSSFLEEELVDSDADPVYQITDEDRQCEKNDLADDGVACELVATNKRVRIHFYCNQ